MYKTDEKINKLILVFLFLQPFIDVLTSIQIRNNIPFLSIGTIIRGLFFLLVLVLLYKNKFSKKMLLMFLIYFILNIMYQVSLTDNSLLSEVSNIIQIFYLPFLIIFFSKYNNEKIDDSLIVKMYLIYLSLIIIPFIFNIGYSLSEVYSNKVGYLGLFYSGNEISAIILGLSPIVLNYIYHSKSYILKVITIIELLVCVFLIGTKTLLLGMILVLLYFFIKFIKNNFGKLKIVYKLIFIILPIVIVSGLIVLLPKTTVYKNMEVTLDYYDINSVSDVVKLENIDNIVFSSRLTFLKNVNKSYMDSSYKVKIFGLGRTEILTIKDVEIDIFDIFYSIGLLGSIVWFIIMICSLKGNKLKKEYLFSFILFILMSLFSGHILIKPGVSIYIAVLFIINRNALKSDKKKILLVSNMYPSTKYKYYGSFVKNTKELLENNNYIVNLVVMPKETNKIIKLLLYIRLHLLTLLKGIFNNYDYIYVHFISHSSVSAVFLKRTSKNLKLVLNAHGNDVVADYDFESKNIKRSKKYLKYADKVVVPSNYFKNIMINDYKIDDSKIFVYPSGGVDTSKFIKLDKLDCMKKCGLNKDYSYIGYISRIEKNKGYDIFLKMIKELKEKDLIKNKRFLLVGIGNEEDKMLKLIEDLDISSYVELRNMVSQSELVNIYNSLDILVFPTYRKSESLGLVGLEAMACKTMVIASNNYGPTDYIIDKENGLFFKPKDYKDLASKINYYDKLSKEEKNKIASMARKTAIKYDTKNTSKLILKVFNEG